MPPSSPTNSRKLSTNSSNCNNNNNQSRNQLVERCSSLRGCEPCKRRKRICNGQRPCTHCIDASQECVYSVVSDHPRSVFTTSTARRLSSGSACETCRRRKTKCDGCSPCSFCASSGIECVNNSERRKRSIQQQQQHTSSNGNNTSDNEAIDRIEDRLRRIEKLMTAFSPSPLAQSTLFAETKELKRVAAGYRKLSSPHPSPSQPSVRQHRHSVPGISVAKDEHQSEIPRSALDSQKDLSRNESTISSASSTSGSLKSFHQDTLSSQSSPPLSPSPLPTAISSNMSPPPSNISLKQSQSYHINNSMTTSMLNNLSLSPSTSSTSSASNHSASILLPHMQPSVSTPTSPPHHRWASLSNNNLLANEWRQNTPFPSLMDQLSKCTFVATAMDYTTVQYPIYPLSPTSPKGDSS
ncbi:hypothetical protein K501DRAFT_234007 [Backusella circina FSU 941]|nr:hypothetical protein K501DRAFT_234007 [Backusella circina FSU 941]